MIQNKWKLSQFTIGLTTALLAATSLGSHAQVSDQEIRDIATETYVYFYPLVFTDLARRQATNVENSDRPGFSPTNTLKHSACFPDATQKPGDRVNLDALSTQGWLDITREPVIVSIPKSTERYYFLSFFDHWSEIFLSLGTRTTGGRAGDYALVPPGWRGTLPKNVERVEAPTNQIRVVGYTQTKGSSDCATANAIQAGFKVTPLSVWNKTPPKPAKFRADPNIDMNTPVVDQVNALSAADFFKTGVDLLRQKMPNLTDSTMLMRMRKIGIEPGSRFDFNKLDVNVRMALAEIPANGVKQVQWQSNVQVPAGKGWIMPAATLGTYGNGYLKRAGAASGGNANLPFDDVIYQTATKDVEGYLLKGDKRYTMRFKKDELPPANAYWSLTLYDETGNVISNSINRTNVNSETALKADTDGSVLISIQSYSPGAASESNWLPSPKGAFSLVLRVFGPRPELTEGLWTPPSVDPVKSGFGFGG